MNDFLCWLVHHHCPGSSHYAHCQCPGCFYYVYPHFLPSCWLVHPHILEYMKHPCWFPLGLSQVRFPLLHQQSLHHRICREIQRLTMALFLTHFSSHLLESSEFMCTILYIDIYLDHNDSSHCEYVMWSMLLEYRSYVDYLLYVIIASLYAHNR